MIEKSLLNDLEIKKLTGKVDDKEVIFGGIKQSCRYEGICFDG